MVFLHPDKCNQISQIILNSRHHVVFLCFINFMHSDGSRCQSKQATPFEPLNCHFVSHSAWPVCTCDDSYKLRPLWWATWVVGRAVGGWGCNCFKNIVGACNDFWMLSFSSNRSIAHLSIFFFFYRMVLHPWAHRTQAATGFTFAG